MNAPNTNKHLLEALDHVQKAYRSMQYASEAIFHENHEDCHEIIMAMVPTIEMLRGLTETHVAHSIIGLLDDIQAM